MLINGFKKVNIMMIEKLRQLKEKSRMTNQQISERSNIPESTVARIFSGKTPNPTIATVVSMVRAMGGSVADFLTDEESGADDGADTETSTAVSEGKPSDGDVSGDELSARTYLIPMAVLSTKNIMRTSSTFIKIRLKRRTNGLQGCSGV